ncbi:MAG: cobalt ECF transporter T component CbiQ [Candidatus Thermoplasmatota archaeon]|nr:cobalt ECF transporter T component CbiQ [Candidatus Thermoplasmatota archaeon]
MKHTHIDEFAAHTRLDFDPCIKLVFTFLFVCAVAISSNWMALAAGFAFMAAVLAISGVPLDHILKRYAEAIPFIAMASLAGFFSGWQVATILFARTSVAVLAIVLLASTTPFFEILSAFQKMRVPQIFVQMLMFTYRYIFVLSDEMGRMAQARKARGFSGGRHIFDKHGMGVISSSIGMVFVRAHERGERVYASLKMRGYDGSIKTMQRRKTGPCDVGFAFCFAVISASILFIQFWEW